MSEETSAWPIIYVRGYAMTRGEIDQTTADPFCGFNIGSTVIRATPDPKAPPRKLIFESPLVRLQSDFDYGDVYDEGVDIGDPDYKAKMLRRSVVIYRYYDEASTLLGSGKTPEIKTFAKGLNDLILKVRDLVCGNPENKVAAKDFRCHLVAHSMGGLVCRAFLQNYGSAEARKLVDKFFTYATPHNGIEVGGINVPEILTLNDISNFNRDYMAKYLDVGSLYAKTKRVDWMPEETFPSRRIFCMVGSNRGDYDAAAGLSRAFAGNGSDGLVRIANASVWGVDEKGKVSEPSATAYCFRSHSGPYGIVNSEEAYQNLVRFLFGDVRVDLWVDVEGVRVPQELEKDDADGKLNALYQFEVLASPRGKRWYLTRRVSEEDSVACRDHSVLKNATAKSPAKIYLSTVFLANRYKANPKFKTLAYSMMIAIRVPDYEVDKKFWADRHFEGGYLYRDSVVIELKPPAKTGGDWAVLYSWQSRDVGQASIPIPIKELTAGSVEIDIPFSTADDTRPRSPGITAKLRCVISLWNKE
jgi:pimeloyl-ACP methyl ester carboxylesterase